MRIGRLRALELKKRTQTLAARIPPGPRAPAALEILQPRPREAPRLETNKD